MAREKMDAVLLMGVGGAGIHTATRVADQLDCPAVAVDTDMQSLADSGIEDRVQLGPALCHGMPARLPAVAALAAEQSRDVLRGIVRQANEWIVIAGLGGGTGMGATPVICEAAQLWNVRATVVTLLPSQLEDAHRNAAVQLIDDLRSVADDLFVYDCAAAFKRVACRGALATTAPGATQALDTPQQRVR